ncbi:MAG: hypothetical protein ACFFEY_08090 [Candidatus Thorarchaeota archaeon]
MNIFKWIGDIEQVYEELINKGKNVNLDDIEQYREQQRKEFENFLNKKNEIVKNALTTVSQEVKDESIKFRDKIEDAIKKIERDFQKNIQNLQKLIITEAGLDF